jgi:hypothetical protein
MTSLVTNRREGVSKSCCGRSRKLCAFTQKELETARAAQELLDAPTIGGGSARPQGGGGGVKEVKKAFQAARNVQKLRQKRLVSLMAYHKNRRKRRFFT